MSKYYIQKNNEKVQDVSRGTARTVFRMGSTGEHGCLHSPLHTDGANGNRGQANTPPLDITQGCLLACTHTHTCLGEVHQSHQGSTRFPPPPPLLPWLPPPTHSPSPLSTQEPPTRLCPPGPWLLPCCLAGALAGPQPCALREVPAPENSRRMFAWPSARQPRHLTQSTEQHVSQGHLFMMGEPPI